jgi:hypothetical protein
MRFRSPSQTCPCSPATRRHPSVPLTEPTGLTVPRCSLSWAFVPYDTVPDRRTRMKATNPFAAACRVRGLATPIATSTTDPPGARSAGASMGFTLQGVPLVRERCSSRSPCPPDVAGRTDPRRGRNGSGCLQGLVPATSPCSHRIPEGNRPSIPSWGSPLQSFLPIRPGHRL